MAFHERMMGVTGWSDSGSTLRAFVVSMRGWFILFAKFGESLLEC